MNNLLGEKKWESKKPAPQPVVRHPKWKFDNLDWSREWNDNPFYRTFLGGLSLLFPDGERFFIRSVKQHLDKIDDPRLKEDAKAFIAQEVQHGRLHERMNEICLGGRYEVASFLRAWNDFAFGKVEKFAHQFLPASIPVSVTAAAEHFTAIWGRNALESPQLAGRSDELAMLFRWHAIEEIEHKHVAFDVLRAVDDNYLIRIAGMLIGGALIGGLSVWGTAHLLSQDQDTDWRLFFETFIKEATDKQGMLRLFAEAFVDYFQPGFHPSDNDDYALAREVAKSLEAQFLAVKEAL